MLADGVVVVQVVGGFVKQVGWAVDSQGAGDVELIVVSAVGAFDMGMFFGMALVVLDELAAEAR